MTKVFGYVDEVKEHLVKVLEQGMDKMQTISDETAQDTLQRLEIVTQQITEEAKSISEKGIADSANTLSVFRQEIKKDYERTVKRFERVESKLRRKADRNDIDMMEIPPLALIDQDSIKVPFLFPFFCLSSFRFLS
jgi:hypothetical protein